MSKATLFVHLAIRVEIEVEADNEEQAREEFFIMPEDELQQAIGNSIYFDTDTYEILNVEVEA